MVSVPSTLNLIQLGTLSLSGCVGLCVQMEMQGGRFTVSVGGWSLLSASANVGVASLPVCQRSRSQYFIAGGEVIGGFGSVGQSANPTVLKGADTEAGIGLTAGTPISGGAMGSVLTFGAGSC